MQNTNNELNDLKTTDYKYTPERESDFSSVGRAFDCSCLTTMFFRRTVFNDDVFRLVIEWSLVRFQQIGECLYSSVGRAHAL